MNTTTNAPHVAPGLTGKWDTGTKWFPVGPGIIARKARGGLVLVRTTADVHVVTFLGDSWDPEVTLNTFYGADGLSIAKGFAESV